MTKRSTVKFWRSVTDPTYCVLWDRKWHYVGRGTEVGAALLSWLRGQGFETEVVPMPRAVLSAYKRHGYCQNALKTLPHFELPKEELTC